jgi:hypothetical protein
MLNRNGGCRIPALCSAVFAAVLTLPWLRLPAPLGAQTETRYEVAASKNVMISMRDGVRLATDIYRRPETAFRSKASFRYCWSARRTIRTLSGLQPKALPTRRAS